MYRAAVMMRGSIVAAVFRKTLLLESSAAKDSAALTLMSSDVDTIARVTIQLVELWACPIEIALAMWFLYRQLGAACAIPITVALGNACPGFPVASRLTIEKL